MNIIDDSLYEEEEQFVVLLLPYYGGRIEENHASSIVLIQEDLSDGKMFLGRLLSHQLIKAKVFNSVTDLERCSQGPRKLLRQKAL